jgi:DNA-binding transcriptional ArsR family regulator
MTHGVHGHTTQPEIDRGLARIVAERMQMLAAPSRILILGHLKHGPSSVSGIADAVEMEASAVSHQLRALRHLGLVVGERRGKHVIYALHDDHVAELLDQAIFHVQHLALGARRIIEPEAG